jgi:hypothetical protein
MTEDRERELAARIAALEFLVKSLWGAFLTPFPAEDRTLLVETLVAASARTDQFEGVARGDDHAAERLADIVIRVQEIVRRTLRQATAGCPQPEGGSSPSAG